MSNIKKIRTTEGDLSIDYNSLDNLPTIPSKVSDLTNDSGFITKSVSSLDNYYTKTEVDEKEVEVTLNGASVSSLSFYAPTTAGTSGQVLKSSGNGAPVWGSVDIDAKENKSNKVTSMTSSSTDLQYPSAKCVYNYVNGLNDKLLKTENINLTINTDYVYSTDWDYNCMKIGNVVFLSINTIAFKVGDIPNDGVILSNLPKPSTEHIFLLAPRYANIEKFRVYLSQNGQLIRHWTGDPQYGDSANKQYGGTIIYLTND